MILNVKRHENAAEPCRRAWFVLCALTTAATGAPAASLDLRSPDGWRQERRGTVEFARSGATVVGKMLLWEGEEFGDGELMCGGRISDDARDGALWLRFRYRSDNEHYALALRGWPCNDLYLFRFGPRGGDKALAAEPLDFEPAPGSWYDLRVVCRGGKIDVFLGNELEPTLSVVDPEPLGSGLAGVGGGYREAEYATLTVEPLAAVPAPAVPPATVSERERRRQAAAQQRQRRQSRAQHRPVRLPQAGPGRQEVSLDGTWLFLPEQERVANKDPRDPKVGDGQWHGMQVPAFWTPVRWWMYAPGEGTSDRWDRMEQARMDALSFDPEATHAAWYRQWVDVPRSYQGKRLTVQFDAVAMWCEVWWNGRHVGEHVGMFGPLEAELPPDATRFGGRNVLTVYVADGTRAAGANLLAAPVTPETLAGLPRGMYQRSAGIWQPVRLVATEPTYLADLFVKTPMDSLDVEATVAGAEAEGMRIRATITDPQTGTNLAKVEQPATGVGEVTRLAARGLAPRPWSPDRPELYDCRVELVDDEGAALDSREMQVGFRTFEVRGNRVYLNGRPYWLRGAGHAISGLCPNSEEVAQSFIGAMHDGNAVVLRGQGSSLTPTWLRATDELGVGVLMEGVWPWVMGAEGEPPSEELLAIWETEWTGVMRRLRNHPSILMWTLNSESFWYRDTDPGRRRRKWVAATRMVKAMRAVDSTRPVICDSGYIRDPDAYAREIEPAGYDDGDVDGAHTYYGWYWPSAWGLHPGLMGAGDPPLERPFTGGRPAIVQEFSTGYPNNDTGHPTRKYIAPHGVAQAWVGDYSYEDRDPAVFLKRHAWLTKELCEVARRHRQRLCGLLAFSNSNWSRFPYLPDEREAYPVYEAMKTALAPVLISAELAQRRFFEGDTLQLTVHVINDAADGTDLPAANLDVQLIDPRGEAISRSAAQMAAVPYYEQRSLNLTLPIPQALAAPERAEYRLALALKVGETEVASNEVELIGAGREWAGRDTPITLGRQPLAEVEGGALAATGRAGIAALRERPGVQAFVENGGRLLILNPGEHLTRFLPGVVAGAVAWRPELVNFEDEASPLLDGLEPWDVCWFYSGGGIPVAATGGYVLHESPDVRVLATAVRPHGYLAQPTDIAQHTAVVLFEAKVGKGKVIVSELNHAAAATDPVAARLTSNLVKYAGSGD